MIAIIRFHVCVLTLAEIVSTASLRFYGFQVVALFSTPLSDELRVQIHSVISLQTRPGRQVNEHLRLLGKVFSKRMELDIAKQSDHEKEKNDGDRVNQS